MKRKIVIEFNHRPVNPDGTHGEPTGAPMFYDGIAYRTDGLMGATPYETPEEAFQHMCGYPGTPYPPEFSNHIGYGTMYPNIYDIIPPLGKVVYDVAFIVTESSSDELRALTLEDMKKLFC